MFSWSLLYGPSRVLTIHVLQVYQIGGLTVASVGICVEGCRRLFLVLPKAMHPTVSDITPTGHHTYDAAAIPRVLEDWVAVKEPNLSYHNKDIYSK